MMKIPFQKLLKRKFYPERYRKTIGEIGIHYNSFLLISVWIARLLKIVEKGKV